MSVNVDKYNNSVLTHMSVIPSEERFIQLLKVGKEVSDNHPDYVKNITKDELKEVYWIILTELCEDVWSSRKILDRAKDKLKNHSIEEIELIVNTETTRILFYNREFSISGRDNANPHCGWTGPCDCWTTPMCYYLQTGSLRDTDIIELQKTGHSIEDLPIIPEEGLTMHDLKKTCRQLASIFGYKMDSEWLMHPGCRHTFMVGDRGLNPLYWKPSN